MTSRRGFLIGMLASGLAPAATWADAGAPDFISAGQAADGSYSLYGLSSDGSIRFRQQIPGRGHAAAAHPHRAQAVGFARRPGTFAFVLDCVTGQTVAELTSPQGRHFYGHGVFSRDGSRLYTAENGYDNAAGVIGVWDVTAGYKRLGEFASHGVGPHDVRLMPDAATLVVANGGIETHPDSGRAKLNIPVMQPSLVYLSLDGDLLERVELDPALHMNSIRHLDLRDDGLVGFAMQWQGGQGDLPPVLATHRRGAAPRLLGGAGVSDAMNGYGGSTAFSGDGHLLAVSSPRGGLVQAYDVETGALAETLTLEDVCGLGAAPGGFIVSAGTGALVRMGAEGVAPIDRAEVRWDNHLVRLTGV